MEERRGERASILVNEVKEEEGEGVEARLTKKKSPSVTYFCFPKLATEQVMRGLRMSLLQKTTNMLKWGHSEKRKSSKRKFRA